MLSFLSYSNSVICARHKEFKVEGIQFHPESVLSNGYGVKLVDNVLLQFGRGI